VKAGDRDRKDVIADAVERGRAFLDAGAAWRRTSTPAVRPLRACVH